MPFNTPNIFIGGTKAKAVEVNENFEAIKDGLNSHTESIVEMQGTVQDTVDYVNGDLKDEFYEIIASARTKFCVNSANTSASGNPDIFTYANDELVLKVGGDYPTLLATSARGKAFKQETELRLTLSTTSGGQNIALNDATLEVVGNIHRQLTEPAYAKDFVRPNLTSNATIGGSGFGVSASSSYTTNYDYLAVNGDLTNDWLASGVVADYIFYNPNCLKVSKLTIRNRNTNNEGTTSGNIYGSNDGVIWSLLTDYANSNTSAVSSWSVTIPESAQNFYNYYKIASLTGVTRFAMSDLAITGQEQLIKKDDIWLKTSGEPLTAYKYDGIDGNGWQNYDGVPLGSVTLSDGTIKSVITFPFNQNEYDVNMPVLTDVLQDRLATRAVVTQSWKAATSGSWYRKWSDGWIEQGGVYSGGSSNVQTFNLLVPFTNTTYFITASAAVQQASAGIFISEYMPFGRTTTTFQATPSGSRSYNWFACGY